MCPGVGIALLCLVFPFMPIIIHRHINLRIFPEPSLSGVDLKRTRQATTKIDNRSFSI